MIRTSRSADRVKVTFALPLDLPARKIVSLEVGGPQLVLTAINEEIDPATVVAVTLTFERAGDVTLQVPFAPPGTPLSAQRSAGTAMR